VLLIQDVYPGSGIRTTELTKNLSSVADPGCLSRIRLFSSPNPNFFNPGSRIRNREFMYFLPKTLSLSPQKPDLRCLSRTPDLRSRIQITNPGIKKALDPGSGYAPLPRIDSRNISKTIFSKVDCRYLKLKRYRSTVF
jgi:hypothetical protein